MKTSTQDLLGNLFQIIDQNCSENYTSKNSERIQIAILKKFFKASEVILEHKGANTRIHLKSIFPESPNSESIIEIESSQLKSFLCDCIAKDTKGISFYTNMLYYITENQQA